MERFIIILLLAIVAPVAFAQKENARYAGRAGEVQKYIWQDTSAAFAVKQTPSELNNESAVIIAKYNEIVNSATSKFKSRIGEIQRINYEVTVRERIKINDKPALDKYSSIAYIKILDLGFSYGFTRIQNKAINYIGAKVIKPDGTETIVNTDEEVLTSNEGKNKEAKLAIPGLQVGDILDYYIKSEIVVETPNSVFGPFTFFTNEEYPVLYEAIKLKLDIESAVQYVSANGAPSFTESTNDAGDIILDLIQTNIPRYNSSRFTSPYRQYPYIRLQCQRATRGYDFYADFSRGKVRTGNYTRDMVNRLTKNIDGLLNMRKSSLLTITRDYFGNARDLKDLPKDSVLKILYEAWRYNRIAETLRSGERAPGDIKYTYSLSLENAVYFSKMLTWLDIDNMICLVRPRSAGSLQHIMNLSDFNALLRVKTDKYYWLAFDDIFTQLNEIPYYFQGEEAITLQPAKTGDVVNYTAGQGKIPITIPAYNSASEHMQVSFDQDMNTIRVQRQCRQTGAVRHDNQKKLLLTEDIKDSMATILEQKSKLEETLKDDRKTQVYAAYTRERNNLKTSFEEEISQHFNGSAKNITDYQIVEAGLFGYTTPFEYRSSFLLENCIKKAGSNYIVEVGKLIGTPPDLDEKNHSQNLDVFISYPKLLNWDIKINIPDGYVVRGIEELNKTINNETGFFKCTAISDTHLINIQVSLQYAHNFEKAANWSKLREVLNPAEDFFTKKILLEKSK